MAKSSVYGAAGVVLLAISVPQTSASADSRCSSKVKSCIVMKGCETSKASSNYCGAIIYVNKGGYVVNPVKLKARGSQPISQPVVMNEDPKVESNCTGISAKVGNDIDVDQAAQFIAPGECAYQLDIDIKAGNHKDRNLFLVPGCVIEMSTAGTTTSNSWKEKVYWSSQAKSAGATGKVQDSAGNNCGRQNKM